MPPAVPVPADDLPPALRPTPDDAVRRERLVRMQRAATLLLVVVAAVYVGAAPWEAAHPWVGYLRAFAEAAMVGGIADWFAVTALFRHPLGIPIPHTAIIPARKDRIGHALGTFVQRNFLAREVVAGKVAALQLGGRAAAWLAEPAHSRRLARHVARGLSGGLEVLRDEDVQALVDQGIVARLRTVPVAPLVARLLELLTAGGRHQALLDDALRLAVRMVQDNEDLIRERIRRESPWWVPGAVEDRIGDRVVAGVERTLAAVAADPDHPLRHRYDEAMGRFVAALREDPEVIARAARLQQELLDHPRVAAFAREVWDDLKARLARHVERLGDDAPPGEPPGTDPLERWLSGLGRKVLAEPELAAKVDGWVVELVAYAVEQAREEVARLIAATVAGWDADATSRKIELQVGRDLQFIRINGTLVGGLVGLLLHAAAALR